MIKNIDRKDLLDRREHIISLSGSKCGSAGLVRLGIERIIDKPSFFSDFFHSF